MACCRYPTVRLLFSKENVLAPSVPVLAVDFVELIQDRDALQRPQGILVRHESFGFVDRHEWFGCVDALTQVRERLLDLRILGRTKGRKILGHAEADRVAQQSGT